MRIAVDAMGGDYAPHEIVKGAVDAVKSLTDVDNLFLVGDELLVKKEVNDIGYSGQKITIKHASEVVEMGETPAMAIRKKKDSSISRCIDMIAAGEANAVVSAGNTGAVVVASTLKLRLLPGVLRPAIATILPTRDRPVVLIDAGANTDCDPIMLTQFGIMGSIYSKVIFKQEEPVVGLMSIGGEDTKGNEITKKAFSLLGKANIKFRGNVEGHDLFKGETDVVVCDGFVGNVILKTSESAAHVIGSWMKEEFTKNPVRKFGAFLLKEALHSMKKKMDPELYGGAPLLGVNGVVIITHGSSSAKAIYHAIRVACEFVKGRLNELIMNEIGKMEKIG